VKEQHNFRANRVPNSYKKPHVIPVSPLAPSSGQVRNANHTEEQRGNPSPHPCLSSVKYMGWLSGASSCPGRQWMSGAPGSWEVTHRAAGSSPWPGLSVTRNQYPVPVPLFPVQFYPGFPVFEDPALHTPGWFNDNGNICACIEYSADDNTMCQEGPPPNPLYREGAAITPPRVSSQNLCLHTPLFILRRRKCGLCGILSG